MTQDTHSNQNNNERYAFQITSPSLGDINVNFLYPRDINIFAELIQKSIDDRRFAVEILYQRFVSPSFSMDEFGSLSDDEILSIANQYIKEDFNIVEGFTVEEVSSFNEFRQAVASFASALTKDFTINLNQALGFVGQFLAGSVSLLRMFAPNKAAEVGPKINSWLGQIEEIRRIYGRYEEYWQVLEERNITPDEISQTLKKYEWFVTPSLPFSLVSRAVELGKMAEDQRDSIDQLFIEYFTAEDFANLTALVQSWEANDILRPRMPIFSACLLAVKQSMGDVNYTSLVIPTLIAQIDGILTEISKQKGLLLHVDPKGGPVRWKDASGAMVNREKWLRGQDLIQDLPDPVEPTAYVLFDILFQTAYLGTPLKIPSSLSRHKIMHGEELAYGSIQNTIRTFLLVDFLANLR